MTDDIIVTSGTVIDGKRILKYVQHISAVAVIGTGFISTAIRNVSDALGLRNPIYEEKLLEGKTAAMDDLCKKAKSLGANAIIGVDVEYTTFISDGIGVAVNGTAVIAEDLILSHTIDFSTYRLDVPFNITQLKIIELSPRVYYGEIVGRAYNINLKAIAGTIYMRSPFNRNIPPATPVEIACVPDGDGFKTAPFPLDILPIQVTSVNRLHFEIEQYLISTGIVAVNGGEYIDCAPNIIALRKESSPYIVREKTIRQGFWECSCGQDNDANSPVCSRCKQALNSKQALKAVSSALTVLPIVINDSLWKCPVCGKQFMPRKSCWSCGAQLEQPN